MRLRAVSVIAACSLLTAAARASLADDYTCVEYAALVAQMGTLNNPKTCPDWQLTREGKAAFFAGAAKVLKPERSDPNCMETGQKVAMAEAAAADPRLAELAENGDMSAFTKAMCAAAAKALDRNGTPFAMRKER